MQPVGQELFNRTAPAWNGVAYPGEGMHYLSSTGDCLWCGIAKKEIRPARTEGRLYHANPANPE